MPDERAAAEFHVEDHPDALDLDVLETQIRHEASAAMGLGCVDDFPSGTDVLWYRKRLKGRADKR